MGDLTVLQKQEMVKGVHAVGSLMGRYTRRGSERLTSPLGDLSLSGRVLAVLGALALLAGAALVAFDALQVSIERGKVAVVARDTVNVRTSPTSNSEVLAKAHSGDRFSVTGSRGEWVGVRSGDGRVAGWISSSLMDTRTTRSLDLRFEMKGYFTMCAVALVVVMLALRMKKLPVEKPARGRASDTSLVKS